MENQLFDWNGWDQQDTMGFTFYNVVLKIKIGDFEPGTKFEVADISYEHGYLQLFNEEKHWDFKLKLVVV